MTNTTNYNFNIVEGTDLVNPLTQLNPNFTSLDSLLKGVSDATITTATEVTSGTAHAIARTLPDANVVRFVATSNWLTGDTMTIDGTTVTPLKTDGTTLKTGDYIIGASVMLIVDGTRCTVYVASSPDASDINYDNTVSGLASNKVQGAVDELAADVDTINSKLVKKATATGTTSASYGNFSLGVNIATRKVIGAYITLNSPNRGYNISTQIANNGDWYATAWYFDSGVCKPALGISLEVEYCYFDA